MPTETSDLLQPIQPAMEATERELDKLLDDRSEAVRGLSEHVARYAGKRLRPAFVHLFGGLTGTPTHEHPKIAALVEALHLASLLHDDVLDGADARHGVATLNVIHDNATPILLGDLIYAKAYSAALDLSSLDAAREFARASRALIRGEIDQTFFRYRGEFDEATYFEIVRSKTGALYEASAVLGALYAGADEDACESAREFGRRLGTAFQIIDDCLDLVGDERVVGKSLGTDLETGKVTLPVIRLGLSVDGERRKRFSALLWDDVEGSRRDALRAEFDFEPVVEQCRREAREYIELALDVVRAFPDGPERRMLLGLGEFVITRSY